MPFHLDDPVPGIALDPARFPVRGWVWLEERQSAITAIVAMSGDVLLGQADVSTFQERADVSTKYRLPPGTRTAFSFTARHPHASVGARFDLELCIRLQDGSLTEPIFFQKGALPPIESDPARMLGEHLTPGACGLEIGAHTLPVPGLSPFYTDMVAVYAGSAGRVDFLADARALPLAADTLDYLCSSHVLEHLADPIAALHEWHRVLRPGGLLYLVVPDMRFTFDEPRDLTSIEHLLRDFREGATTAANLPHVDEFVFHTDWSRLHPATPRSERWPHQRDVRERYLRDLEEGKSIDIHYHTFTPESLHGVLQAAGFIGGDAPSFDILARAERYPAGRDDGIGLLLRKTGGPVNSRAPLETFTLSLPRSRPSTTLPLVCPISLNTLRPGTAADGTPVLIATDSGLTYPFQSGLPSLLPPSGAKPIRPWGVRSWPDAPSMLNSGSAGHSSFTLMRSHIDEPTPAAIIDPLCFFVRGWLWLDAQHPAIAAVEVWSGNLLIGETSALYDRADVVAAFSLPAGVRNGFEVFAHHPAATTGEPVALQIRARLSDGSRTPVLAHMAATALARDYRQNHFGILLDQHTTAIQRHPNIFATGP